MPGSGGRAARPGDCRPQRRPFREPRYLLLIIILVVQAALSLRLIWRNTAFQDEALYLWAGHLEIGHWLHGAPIPAFPTYFSGSPVLYPPLGALADSVGGLAAARALSLLLMLGATTFLWLTTERLCGWRAAYFASAGFAVLGVTQRLGAFATFDAMSLCLLALAAWCAVRAGESQHSHGWLASAALALALANATKYASALFDPLIISLAVIEGLRVVPLRRALMHAGTILLYSAAVLIFLYSLGGDEYATGVTQTTLARAVGVSPASSVYTESWHLTGLVLLPALVGLLLSYLLRSSARERILLLLLVGGGLLVPLEQARIHTTTSLDKHLDYGAWFAMIAGGYAVEKLILLIGRPAVRRMAMAILSLGIAASLGGQVARADALFADWPDSAALVTAMAKIMPGAEGPVLAEHPSILEYYLPSGHAWYRWSSTRSIRQSENSSISPPVGESLQDSAFLSRIRSGFFSTVVLDFGITSALDQQLITALQMNPNYQLVGLFPYGKKYAQVWKYSSQAHFAGWERSVKVSDDPFYDGILAPSPHTNSLLQGLLVTVAAAGCATILILVLIRGTWRRRKAIDEI